MEILLLNLMKKIKMKMDKKDKDYGGDYVDFEEIDDK